MSVRRAEIQRWGNDRLRVRAWRGSKSVALVSPMPGQPPVSPASIRKAGASLQQRGFVSAVTSALNPTEERAFLAGGYVVRERLHLLCHNLIDLPEVERPRNLVRARRSDTSDILAADNAAFGEFWRLDTIGLQDAIAATPTARVRVSRSRHDDTDSAIVGYAIGGRSGHSGYLQRLAVHPDHQGRGLGRDLVTDSLRWMRRRGATKALVNTQVANDRALNLYLAAGFRPETHGLAVLECDLTTSS